MSRTRSLATLSAQQAARRSALDDALVKLAAAFKLDDPTSASLLTKLSARPRHVYMAEARLLTSSDADLIGAMPGHRVTSDDAAMLETLKAVVAPRGSVSLTWMRWRELDANMKRAARRRKERHETRQVAHRRSGRPPGWPYRTLLESYVAAIEMHTGTAFRFGRRNGEPGGTAMDALVAALDLALFASGAPPRESIARHISSIRRAPPIP
jgi:hypothetical protein